VELIFRGLNWMSFVRESYFQQFASSAIQTYLYLGMLEPNILFCRRLNSVQ
jgi:hypothetical protein